MIHGCDATVSAENEDGNLMCDLAENHLGQHWDPEYGEYFTTPGTDPR